MTSDLKVILLVEDDWMLAAHWRDLLENEGYRVVHEATVESAIDSLASVKFDLVITDIMVDSKGGTGSREGGLEVISYIALHMESRPKLIAISGAVGHSQFVDRNFNKLDALRALRKPVSEKELLGAVNAAIESSPEPKTVDQTQTQPTAAEPAAIQSAAIQSAGPSSPVESPQSESQLRETVQLLRAVQHDLRKTQFVVDQSGDAIYRLDLDGKLLYANDAACSLMGYTASEMLSMSITDLAPECTTEIWQRQIERLKSTGAFRTEAVHRSKEEKAFDVELHLHYYEYEDETFVVAFVQDISQRKATARKLQAASDSLRAMVQLLGVTDGVWDWDVASGQTSYAPGFRRLLGFAGDDTVHFPERYTSLESRVHPDDIESLIASLQRCFESKQPFTNEFRIRNALDQYIWVRSRGNAAFDESGKPIRVVGSTHDIDQAKQAELALQRTQAALDTAPDAVLWVRPDSTIAYANQTACDRLGYTQPELLELQIGDLHPGGVSHQRFSTEIWPELKSATKLIFESTHQTKDGESFAVEISSRLIEFGDEEFGCSFVRDISDRLERERLLDDVQEKVQLAAKAGNIGFWDWNVDTQEVYYSPEWHIQLGEEPDTLSGYLAFSQRVHPDELAYLEGLVQECLDGVNESFRHTFRMKHTDGTWRWILSAGKLVAASSNKPAMFAGIHIDVTSEKLALQEQERFFSTAVDLFAVLDKDTQNFVKVSPNWKDILGYSDEDLLGSSLSARCHPDDKGLLQKAFEALSSGAPLRGCVLRWAKEAGEYRYLEFNADPPKPGETAVFITARDVTETDTQVFRSLARVVPQILYIYDLRTQAFTFQSRDLAESLGHAASDVYSTDEPMLEALAHPDDRSKIRSHIRQVSRADDNEILELDFRIRDSKDSWQHLLCRSSIFKRAADGEVQQIVGSATNLNELEILKRYAGELEEVNAELQQFAYIASHDLKQPLRGIDNLAKWIREDCDEVLPAKSKEHLQLIEQRIVRMEKLVDDLLAYSRAGRDRSAIAKKVDLQALVQRLAQDLSNEDEIQLEYIGEPISLVAVVVELEVVLRNLFGNAVKHSPNAPKIEVSATVSSDFVEIAVADDGPGIAPEYHESIFGMFQTLKARDEVEGSGMGLAIVKKLINGNGGEIYVESQAGHGATFKFTWPLIAQ